MRITDAGQRTLSGITFYGGGIGIIVFTISLIACIISGFSTFHYCRGKGQTDEELKKCDKSKDSVKSSGISVAVGAGLMLTAAVALFINYYISKKRSSSTSTSTSV